MPRGLLPEHIGPLVDRLRSGDHQALSLPDVAALTEVLMRSLESYFKTVDLTIYAECQSLADYMEDAKSEIASLSPDHSDEVGIPRAGLELAAIVEQTESATNTIMESAELIMEADPENMEAYKDTVNDAVMKIFEACSFQDITGQRISKVVNTLEHVEERVAKLVNILGVLDAPAAEKNETEESDVDDDEALLNGPALAGEGIDQTEIDALLNGEMPSQPEAEANAPEVSPEVSSEDDTIESDQAAEASKTEPDVQPETHTNAEAVSTTAADTDVSEPEIVNAEGNLAVNTLKVANLTVENLAVETLVPSEEPDAEAVEEPVAEAVEEPVVEAVTEPVVEAVEEPDAEASEHATTADIDSMFDGPVESEPAEDVSVAPDKEEAKPNLIEEAKARKAQAQAEKKAKIAPPKPVVYEEDAKAGLSPKSSENTTQSDIDALFS